MKPIRASHSVRRRPAFTLIEMLMVIGIVGILAALLFSAISSVKSRARSVECNNHLHQMGIALQLYVDDHQGRYPYYRGLFDPALDKVVGRDNTGFWWAKLLQYYPIKWTDPAYHCPGYKGPIKGSIAGTNGGWSFPEGSYAYNAKGVKAGAWYATNGLTLGLGGRPGYPSQRGKLFGVATEGQIVSPSEMFSIGESRWLYENEKVGRAMTVGGHDYMECGAVSLNRGVMSFDPKRHGTTYNQLFCDGHVDAMSPWVIFDPTKSAAMWNYDHQPHPEAWSRLP